MDKWQDWVTTIIGIAVTYTTIDYRLEKTRKQKEIDDLKLTVINQSERIIKLESQVVSDKEVREIMKEFFFPLVESIGKIQEDTQQIKLDIAKLQVRGHNKDEDSAV